MKLASIALETPSLKVSNDDILDYIGHYSTSLDAPTLTQCQREVAYLLKKTGSDIRYYRDRDKNESAISCAEAAIGTALTEAGITKEDIDLIIYCGVGRGYMEPANAYFIAQMLDINCNGFDVIDACMSWARSLEIAGHYLQNPDCHNVLVVNAEFTVYEYGFPQVFQLENREKIAYTFPAYTIGEGSTATVVQKSDDAWRFDYRSDPKSASLCNIPLQQYREFCRPDEFVALNGIAQFVSFGSRMFEQTEKCMGELVAASDIKLADAELLFPHGAAVEPIYRIAEKLSVPRDKVFNEAFPAYGNLISASIPAAMKMAIDQGVLSRGMKCILCPASAGMSFGLVEFVY